MVIVRAEGPSFSAGLDRGMLTPQGVAGEPSVLELAGLRRGDSGPRSPASSAASPSGRRCRPSSSAAVQGAAIGAGFQLALACDLRVVADDARSPCGSQPRPGARPGGYRAAGRLVGYARALEICATGRAVHADEAVRLGLAQVAVPRARAGRHRPATWPARSCRRPAAAVREPKPLLRRAVDAAPAAQQQAEREAQARLLAAMTGS